MLPIAKAQHAANATAAIAQAMRAERPLDFVSAANFGRCWSGFGAASMKEGGAAREERAAMVRIRSAISTAQVGHSSAWLKIRSASAGSKAPSAKASSS